MHERVIEIPTADGRMETFITHPEEGGPFAPVVIYMDVWGLREELYDIARKVAVVGYYVLLPDLYYRQGRIRHQWRNERGQMISMHNLDPERQAQVRAPLQKLSDAMVVADSGAILDFLGMGEPVRPGGVGSIGYCMGGRHVMCVAGAFPERFVAGASLHGTQLVSDRDDSPPRLADRLRGELYCGFAEKDRMPRRRCAKHSVRRLPGARSAIVTWCTPAPNTATRSPTATYTTRGPPTGTGK